MLIAGLVNGDCESISNDTITNTVDNFGLTRNRVLDDSRKS